MESHRTGLLIIRAWVEEGAAEPLRVRLRISTDVSVGFERTLTLVQPEEVDAAVREWLADMLSGEERPLEPGDG